MYLEKNEINDPSTEVLARQIIAFIGGEGNFDDIARQIFAYQYHQNIPYRNFCQGRGITPESLTSWCDIPPAPVAAFKQFDLTAVPIQQCQPSRGGRVFHSSGTTGSETSRHYLDQPSLDVYRAALRDGFARFVLADGAKLPIFALMPPPFVYPLSQTPSAVHVTSVRGGAPHSSLSFMLGELITDYGGAFFSLQGWQQELAVQLKRLSHPVVVFGTAFAFVHFFDAVEERFTLPAGSRIVETGGFKGRSREISRDELYALFTERLGIPPTHCISEYGMSEMASQFYDSTFQDFVEKRERPVRKIAPPTIRTRIIDPITGQNAATGQEGLLAHYDVCNLNSLVAIQTEDMGRFAEDGDGFILLGRAPGAILRGCSLTAEEWQATLANRE